MAKIVETALPLAEINEAAIREKAGKTGRPANMHLWWGRSPLASSLAALAAAALDFSRETAAEDAGLLAAVARGDRGALERARERLGRVAGLPPVWDPFSGYGGIPFAAQTLGLRSAANDLNPVAALLTKAAVEFPARFSSLPPVHPGAPLNAAYSGAEGLAEDVRYYGEWLARRARDRLADVYPPTASGETPLAWLWVRTVRCPNPACGREMPLAGSYVLRKSGGAPVWAEPSFADGGLAFEMREGDCPKGRESNKVGEGARFRCPFCGEVTTDAYVKKKGQAREMGAVMMAVVTDSGGGKSFAVPDETQRAAAAVRPPDDVPALAMPRNAHSFSPPGYGFARYADLFTARQLLALSTFADLVCEAQNVAASAALAAGMSETGGPLEDGGAGALAYGQAVGVYLALAVDRLAEYGSSMCSWRADGANVRSVFGRQAVPMVWTFAEGNPFSGVAGNFKSSVECVAAGVARSRVSAPAVVSRDNAVTMEHPKDALVCVELPYYRDVAYADLSDFFYIWLRRALKGSFPKLFRPEAAPRDELSTVSTYAGASKDEAEALYRSQLKTVCEKLYASASADYPALLFCRVRVDDLAGTARESAGEGLSAWEFMLESLMGAGFAVTAVWPARAEPVSQRACFVRALIVARKDARGGGRTTRREFIRALKRELPGKVETILSARVRPEDELLSFLGQGLGVFSRFREVLNADGTAMSVREALRVVGAECADAVARRIDAASQQGAETAEG